MPLNIGIRCKPQDRVRCRMGVPPARGSGWYWCPQCGGCAELVDAAQYGRGAVNAATRSLYAQISDSPKRNNVRMQSDQYCGCATVLYKPGTEPPVRTRLYRLEPGELPPDIVKK